MTDWGGLVNKGLGRLEGGWESTKSLVGEGVDKATNGIGGALDYVGAHDWADGAEDWGDDVASGLGASVREQQLGQTEQANELIHGSPSVIRESAKHFTDFQTAFDRVGAGMRALDSGSWKGAAADAFRERFALHPADWMRAADACEAAGKALLHYTDTVEWAQTQAQQAIDLYKQAEKTSKDAHDAYMAKVDTYNAAVKAGRDPGPEPMRGADSGEALSKQAQELLAEARRQRDGAAERVQRVLEAAMEHAPAEPPPLTTALAGIGDYAGAQSVEFTHFVGGAVKGTAGLANFARGLNPLDPYNVTHLADYLRHSNMTLAGLVTTAAHPERIPAALIESFKSDPSEGLGRMVPELFGTKGLGGARVSARLSPKESIPGRSGKILDGLASRGSGSPLPDFEDVRRAVVESKPEPLSRSWPDTDGRYYASRVLKGGRPDGETVLAGHGYIEMGAGEIIVPPGTKISFYVPHGDRIPGLNGVAIEGGSYPGGALETFGPGDRIPNYTLAPPEAKGAGGFTVYENSTTVAQRTMLSDLLKGDMGNVHWAACREFK
ncbi:WXG100 family type VII secretion target [Streptomyces sp. TE33382]